MSDWSSDVCSSDLHGRWRRGIGPPGTGSHHTHAAHHRTVGISRRHERGGSTIREVHEKLGALARCQGYGLQCYRPFEQPPFSRSEEHTSELQSLMRNSYAVLCLKKKKKTNQTKV